MGSLSDLYLLVRAWIIASFGSSRTLPDPELSNDNGAIRLELLEAGKLPQEAVGKHRSPPQVETATSEAAAPTPDEDDVPSVTPDHLQPSTAANQSSTVTVEQSRKRTNRKEILFLSFLTNISSIGIVINLFYIRRATEPISKNPSLVVASTFAFLSLLLGFGLMLDTTRQLMMCRWNLPLLWSKHLLCFSIMSLIFAVVSVIAAFLPKTYYYMPVVLVPTLMVICMSFDHAPPQDIVAGVDPQKADRKRSFQLAVNMTTCSIMGALGALIGYHKNTSNRADQAYVKVAIYFMLSASLTGLVTLLLNRMLRSWKDWKKTAVANAIMLGLLLPAVLMVATTFLGGAVAAAAAFPVAVASATWYIMEYYHPCDDGYGQHEAELKPLYTVALAVMSLSFGAVMAIFASFLGGEPKGESLGVCIFSLVSCFVSSVVLGMVTFRSPKKASLGDAAKLLYYLALLLLVLAALALVSYVG